VRSVMRHLPPDPLTVTPGTRSMDALRSRCAPKATAVVLTDGALKLIDTVRKTPDIRAAYAIIEAFTPATVQVHQMTV
jgi:hypothetical protein